MRQIVRTVATSVVAVLLLCGVSSAEEFLLGKETRGITFKGAENTDLTVRVRLTPRFDAGDLIKSDETTPTSYENDTDFYLRRVRLEFSGHLAKDLTFNVILRADTNGQAPGKTKNTPSFLYAYGEYKVADALSVRFGKSKLPYSRVSLTSAAEQLFLERPYSTEAAKLLFDDYYQPALLLQGKVAGGSVAYAAAVGDGFESGGTISGNTVQKGGLLYVARLALSPPGWVEKGQSDAHLGRGRHLTLAANYAVQSGIEYRGNAFEEDRSLWGADLSGHWGGLTAQVEYNSWKEDYSNPALVDKKPKGWYAQLGYLFPGLNVEPAVRYEVYDQNANAADKKQKTITAGLNWYLRGHNVKVGANFLQTKFDRNATGFLANDDKQNIFQLESQLYF